MTPNDHRRAITLSISLTPELSEAVSERVQSGLYTSASELIREALRLLLRTESDRQVSGNSNAASRLASAVELMELGLAMRAEKIRQAEPGLSEAEVQRRLDALSDELETGSGLRLSPERLEKLTLREED